MNADRLRMLMTVLQKGSFSAAAEEENFTPSGISRMMAALEEEMGFTLLVRGKEGVKPTTALEKLLPSIREYLHQDEKLRQETDEIRGVHTGTVVIGCAYSGIYKKLESVITDFRNEFPGISFQLRSGFSTELLEQLTNQEIDLCISTIRDEARNAYKWKHVGRDKMVLWVPAHSPLAEKQSLPLSILEQEAYIDIFPGKDIDNHRIFDQFGIRPNIQFEAMDSYTAYSMVDAGLGIAMNSHLNSAYTGGSVREIPIEPALYLEIGLAYLQDSSPAAARFADFVNHRKQESTGDTKNAKTKNVPCTGKKYKKHKRSIK